MPPNGYGQNWCSMARLRMTSMRSTSCRTALFFRTGTATFVIGKRLDEIMRSCRYVRKLLTHQASDRRFGVMTELMQYGLHQCAFFVSKRIRIADE